MPDCHDLLDHVSVVMLRHIGDRGITLRRCDTLADLAGLLRDPNSVDNLLVVGGDSLEVPVPALPLS